MGGVVLQVEVCRRCGSPYLSLKDLDSGRSSFSQVLKCNSCGSETLIPRRNDVHSEKIRNAGEEKQTKEVWKARIEQVPHNITEINVHYFSKGQCTLVPGKSENGR